MKKDYYKKVETEIEQFKNNTQVHLLPDIFHFWSKRFLYPKLKVIGYNGYRHMFLDYIRKARNNINGHLKIVSIGCGNCDFELDIATQLEEASIDDYSIECIDINANMLERGRNCIAKKKLLNRFILNRNDFNTWAPTNTIHIAIANQSLHHVIELEHLFDSIAEHLHQSGFFLINDMIGRNGHMRWPEAEYFIRKIWNTLDKRFKYNWQHKKYYEKFVNWDCSIVGFEGIRAQDILPLLIKRYNFKIFFAFNNIISPFIGRSYGHNFDSTDPYCESFISTIAKFDEALIEAGIISPTQMFAALTKNKIGECTTYKHLTPEFCIRNPQKLFKGFYE